MTMDQADFGRDLQLVRSPQVGAAAHLLVQNGDLLAVDGLANLAQAIWLRLSTPLGDLEHLGHPDFGCRLHLLVGRLVNTSTIALAKAYVREALRREPRLASVLHLEVRPDPLVLGSLVIEATVKPVGYVQPVALTMSFGLEPGGEVSSRAASRG